MTARTPDHALRAGLISGIAYLLIGWRGLIVPSLIRLIAPAFGQGDAGMGTYFLATTAAYGVGSMLGGRTYGALGSRVTLAGATALVGLALLVQATTASWVVFLVAGLAVSLGASTVDVGINVLVLDLFPGSRGRALNLIHVAYGSGALLAPMVIALAIALGLPWPGVFLGSGLVALATAVALAATVPARFEALPEPADAAGTRGAMGSRRFPLVLVALAVSVMGYVAAEAGVSDWLVRYLEVLPQALASLALTLFWSGIVVGRLVFVRLGGRLDPARAAPAFAAAGGVLVLVALLVPVGAVTPFLFALVGTTFGPVFPLIVAAAAARLPGRSATVSSTLITSAVVGALVYPPSIGFLSEAIGLHAAMLGVVVAVGVSAVASTIARRIPARVASPVDG